MSEEACLTYPKIETLFRRDADHKVLEGQLRCPEFAQIGRWPVVTEKVDGTNIRASLENSSPTLDPACWIVRFYGRTSRAQIPAFLLEHLQDTFTLERMTALWRGRNNCRLCEGSGWLPVYDPDNKSGVSPEDVRCECVEPYPIALYGEGYGARIQKGGGNYRPDSVSFRLFDVHIGGKWLDWGAVKNIAGRVGIETVPAFDPESFEDVIKATGGSFLDALVALVKPPGFNSSVAQSDRPGLDWDKTWVAAEGIVARTDPSLYDWHGRPLRFKLKTGDFAA